MKLHLTVGFVPEADTDVEQFSTLGGFSNLGEVITMIQTAGIIDFKHSYAVLHNIYRYYFSKVLTPNMEI